MSTRHSAHFIHRFPTDEEYSFRLVLNGHRPNQSEPAHPALFIDGKPIRDFEVDATDLEGQIVETRARVTAGEHLLSATYPRNYHGLPPSYNGPEPLIGTRGQLTEKDIETLRKYGTRIKTDAVETRVDNRYESLDVGGPFDQVTAASPESLRRIYVCGHAPGKHIDTCARTILTSFAGRAFRRPATSLNRRCSCPLKSRRCGIDVSTVCKNWKQRAVACITLRNGVGRDQSEGAAVS